MLKMFPDAGPHTGAVRHDLLGDAAPAVRPGPDPAMLGSARLEATGPVEVRTFQSFTLVYTVGALGIDDTGGIRIGFRTVGDGGRLQTSDPGAPNYVSARSNGEGRLVLSYDKSGGQRPWAEILTIRQTGGYLRPGEKITIFIGDRSKGSPGYLMQTFAEAGREFRVFADVQATGHFYPLPDTQLTVPVVAGPPVRWHAVLPTLRRPGEPFTLGLRADDAWGNPTARARARLMLVADVPVRGLPSEIDFAPEDRALRIDGLTAATEGTLRIRVFEGETLLAETPPLVIRDGDLAGYWADLHGQSGETIGTGTIESYMDFARDKAFLDVTSHQANDFQIRDAFWDHLNTVTAAWNAPGRFTVFPGYEWSGNTAVGGDHNVFFRHEGATLRRCSHALLADPGGLDADATTLTDLYRDILAGGDDTILFAHVGGRYANIHYDHDPLLETAVEIHSDWGTFEWILKDSLDLERRVGVVANSDGHKGRPGSSYPGASHFGAFGGLTCYLAPQNDRDAIFEAMRRRHHYATTGCRMAMDVSVAFDSPATLFHRNPLAAPDEKTETVSRAIMGDIVQTGEDNVTLSIDLDAHVGIERVEIWRGTERLECIRPEAPVGNRARVLWSGAENRGRGRDTLWRGRLSTGSQPILRMVPINHWNPERLLERRGASQVVWESVTTGNIAGLDLWLPSNRAELEIETNLGGLKVALADLDAEDAMLDAGGLGRQIRVTRLPDAELPRHLSVTRQIALKSVGDTVIWVSVTTEDGHRAWSSPVYLFQ